MADHLTLEKRSWNMSRIHSSNTNIEVKVRSFLFSQGFRFRKNDKSLPGKPDVVLPKYRTVIFIHGCFWHSHQNCRISSIPKTNTGYWEKKFANNILNDLRNETLLRDRGYTVITLWQCDIEKRFESTMESLIKDIRVNKKSEDNTNGID